MYFIVDLHFNYRLPDTFLFYLRSWPDIDTSLQREIGPCPLIPTIGFSIKIHEVMKNTQS